MESTPLICASALAGVPALIRQAFGENLLSRVNRAVMLDVELIEGRDCFIPHATLAAYAETAAKLASEDNLGLMLSPYLTIANYGCWGRYVLGAETLGEAAGRAVGAMDLHSRSDRMAVQVEGPLARISYSSAAKGLPGYVHVACGTVGVLLSLCRSYLPATWRPLRVELDIPRPRRSTPFEEIFGCPVVFDAPGVAVCIEAHDLDRRHSQRPALPHVTIEEVARARIEHARPHRLIDVVSEHVWTQVLAGSVSIESTARALDVSIRTLQRELSREGTDFRSVTAVARGRRAAELLRGTRDTITSISAELGYSSPAHFARAFRKATGLAPQSFRREEALA